MTEDTSIKANWATSILTDPMFMEMFEEMRQQAYADIRNSNPADVDSRDTLYHDLRALDRIQDKLQSYLDNHKVVESRKKTE